MRLPLGLPCGGSQLTCTLEPEAAKPAQTAAHLQWIAWSLFRGSAESEWGCSYVHPTLGACTTYVLV